MIQSGPKDNMSDSSRATPLHVNPNGCGQSTVFSSNVRQNHHPNEEILASLHLQPSTTLTAQSRSKRISSAPNSVISIQGPTEPNKNHGHGQGHVRRASTTIVCMENNPHDISNLTNANFVQVPVNSNPNANNGRSTKISENEEKNGKVYNNSTIPQPSPATLPIPAPATLSNPKVPLVSRFLPMSRKTSQIVPSYTDQDDNDTIISLSTKFEQVPLTDLEEVTLLKAGPPLSAQRSEAILLLQSSETTDNPNPKANIEGAGNEQTKSESPGVGLHDGASTESCEDVCRICHDNAESRMTLLSPCLCKGSMGKVHRKCLERWLGESVRDRCEICGHEYITERHPRYTGWRSVVAWIRNPLHPTDTRNLFFDLACFFILTPLAAISAWLCVTLNPENQGPSSELSPLHDDTKGGLNGKHHKFRKSVEASNSTWTSVGLLTLTGTLLAAYYVWLFVAARYHIQVWREWQSRNFVVTIVNNPELIQEARLRAAAEAAGEAVGRADGEGADSQQNNKNSNNNNGSSNKNAKDSNNKEKDRGNASVSDESSTSANNNNNTNAQNGRSQQRKLRDKNLARAFEETSLESIAGPSNFHRHLHHHHHHRHSASANTSDIDSLQGKIFPSEASVRINIDSNGIATTSTTVTTTIVTNCIVDKDKDDKIRDNGSNKEIVPPSVVHCSATPTTTLANNNLSSKSTII